MKYLKITAELLRSLDACDRGRIAFERDYPSGIVISDHQEFNIDVCLELNDDNWYYHNGSDVGIPQITYHDIYWLILQVRYSLKDGNNIIAKTNSTDPYVYGDDIAPYALTGHLAEFVSAMHEDDKLREKYAAYLQQSH